MEELDETPVDIPRRNSEDGPNEDRPASGADQGRDGGTESADGHAQRTILLLSNIATQRRAPHLFSRCAGLVVVVSVEANLLIILISWFIHQVLKWIVVRSHSAGGAALLTLSTTMKLAYAALCLCLAVAFVAEDVSAEDKKDEKVITCLKSDPWAAGRLEITSQNQIRHNTFPME